MAECIFVWPGNATGLKTRATHTLSKRQASCHCYLATVGAKEQNPRGGGLMLNKVEGRERKETCRGDASVTGKWENMDVFGVC